MSTLWDVGLTIAIRLSFFSVQHHSIVEIGHPHSFFLNQLLAKPRVHDNSSKDTLSNGTISLQRQLVYYDSLSNATLSLLLFLPTTFGRKKVKV